MIQAKNEKDLVRHKLGNARTAMLRHLDPSHAHLPMIATVLLVEEDGQMWMDVRTKKSKWECTRNLPISLQFNEQDCNIHMAGLGSFIHQNNVPHHIPVTESVKSVMRFRPQYGEYIPLPEAGPGRSGVSITALTACRQLLDLFTGRTNRRLLIFH